jgi:hypothetical protein
MSFAALEARLNQAAKARISNAAATWWRGGMDMGVPVPGLRVIYDRESAPGFGDGTVVDAQSVASVLAEDAPGIGRKCALRITRDAGDTTPRLFTVLKAEPDGTGWVQVFLTEDAL